MKESPQDILRAHNIKYTPQRAMLLKVFIQKDKAMNLPELNKYLKDFDRITLYRSLNAFEEKGLIHKIPDKDGNAYALCKHSPIEHSHEDNHVHFKCNNCEMTLCLDELEIPQIPLPKKFVATKYNFLIEGICGNCSSAVKK
ncbi:MAG TPA: transcriptional repressor [Cytophagaceae bacterium]|jgi:Fur family ferric uptake transcriptional regulator